MADRLTRMLEDIDGANYDRAVPLAYTGLEGFSGAFFRSKEPERAAPNELIVLSRWIRDCLRQLQSHVGGDLMFVVVRADQVRLVRPEVLYGRVPLPEILKQRLGVWCRFALRARRQPCARRTSRRVAGMAVEPT